MEFLTQLIATLAVVSLTGCSVARTNKDGTFELLILHNNDMHAKFEQTSQLSGVCTEADMNAGKCYGGFARVAYLVKQARKAAQTGEGPPVLYLNAGDTYTGSPWFAQYKWKIAAEFINALQPDAVSLGNNEINETGKLSPLLQTIQTNITISNVILKSAEQNENFHKSIIVDVNGVKIGLIGYLTPDTELLKHTEEVEYIDELVAIRDEVLNLQKRGVKIIIVFGHSNLNKAIEIAKEIDGVDFVISGHKNLFFWNGTSTEFIPNEKVVVTQSSGKRVPVIQSSTYSKYLGKLHVKFDPNGEFIEYTADPILLDSTQSEDPEALKLVEKLDYKMDTKSNEVIGKTAVVLDGSSCSKTECNIGNLITDAMMYYHALRFDGTQPWTDAPIAIIHGGAIAASIAPANRPAPIIRSDLESVLPLESNVAAVTVTGNVLKEILEHSVADYNEENPSGRFLQFSGIRVEYNIGREPGSRVVNAVARCGTCFVPEFYSIDDWRSYKILMPAALANGEFDYHMIKGLPREDYIYDEIASTSEFIRLRSPVYPEVANRIVLGYSPNSATTLRSTILIVLCVLLRYLL